MDDSTCKSPESRDFERDLSKISPFEIKNKLIEMAEEKTRKSTATFLNAGRGNPNWVATEPREAFILMNQWALEEARLTFDDKMGIAGLPTPQGGGKRLLAFLDAHKGQPGEELLRQTFNYLVNEHKSDPDAVAYEWSDGILGDEYPTPPRILDNVELICRDYLRQIMAAGVNPDKAAAAGTFDIFATEGGTAAMCYAFDTLQQNFLVEQGDRIALMTPIFTPYLEIPQLARFNFDVVNVSANKIEADGYHYWQYPKEEIDKLRDPRVKLVCLVNPSNPPSVTLSDDVLNQLMDVVKNDNPELMIVTDDVYATFVPGFRSLMYELPYNTLTVYSFSKYFGATGWRLANIAVNQKNIFDDKIARLGENQKLALDKRYESLSLHPREIKFIDRLVADSRDVALNHTAGLSTPQQMQMTLMASYCLFPNHGYQTRMMQLINKRLDNLWSTTGFTLVPDKLRAGYYSELDMMVWAKKFYGDDFAQWMDKTYESLDFVIRLAAETAIVLLNGDGFDGPKWSIRVSLANLDTDAYLKIGTAIRRILEEYHSCYQATVDPTSKPKA